MRTKSSAAKLQDSSEVFAALGTPVRLHLVSRLCDQGPLSLSELRAGSDLTRQAITKHLKVLEQAKLVHYHREGREQIWELESHRLKIAMDYLNLVSNRWDEALGRLKNLVES
jgi:DNA-binding transcriptional ArsR family regulator